ncbi:MAG: ornithine carbamoyltransferase [Candidatus Omnitrophica bacterium]|nr:ornithine carbamoyltransferase [Candidatus Omnitrophota bacterium]MBU1924697.1 ornithine carbamoyltransferase [Candidatus Omnitrophota bacterium]
MNKDLISGFDIETTDIQKVFARAAQLKKQKRQPLLTGKIIGLIFQKPSVRTRVSFEVAAEHLGARCIYLAPEDVKLGQREPITDVARVLSRYLDAIVARTFKHAHVEELAQAADIAVINGLSDLYHPCQALADIFTIYERKSELDKVKIAFIGDGNNVLHSLLAITAKTGMTLSAATPKGYEPDRNIFKAAQNIAKKTGASLTHTNDIQAAVNGADFVYTDVWTSMGQEKERKKRMRDFKKFQVNSRLLKSAGKGCLVMHCMPVHRGEEISAEVMDSKHSIVYEQAENRLHVQKAVMALLLK